MENYAVVNISAFEYRIFFNTGINTGIPKYRYWENFFSDLLLFLEIDISVESIFSSYLLNKFFMQNHRLFI